MENKMDETQILVESSSHGFSISIHGKKGADGDWLCAVEQNEMILSDYPTNDFIQTIEQERIYEKTEFILSFDDAFKKFDQEEWFLCRPQRIHKEFAEFFLEKFENRIEAYSEQETEEWAIEKFMLVTRIKEWRAKAAAAISKKS